MGHRRALGEDTLVGLDANLPRHERAVGVNLVRGPPRFPGLWVAVAELNLAAVPVRLGEPLRHPEPGGLDVLRLMLRPVPGGERVVGLELFLRRLGPYRLHGGERSLGRALPVEHHLAAVRAGSLVPGGLVLVRHAHELAADPDQPGAGAERAEVHRGASVSRENGAGIQNRDAANG